VAYGASDLLAEVEEGPVSSGSFQACEKEFQVLDGHQGVRVAIPNCPRAEISSPSVY